ncbi:MAG: DUF4407 domain-containing protein [Bacteroidetes bacterium]|nr:DUF4407 domain-containing protein [Bacteroidota bacterium]
MAANDHGKLNGLFTYDSFGAGNKKTESHFLWWCAGAHQQLLKDYPSEHTKYAGLGGVILATFALASLSSGYAIYSVFNNWAWALGFAILWGLIIFNFDRFLVSTMRKYGVGARKQFWMAVPRILLALLIGITIARPLELKIFEKEVDVKMAENQHKKLLLNDSLLLAENKTAMENAMQERAALSNRKLAIEDTLARMRQAYVQEADGTGGSLHRGIDKLTRLKEQAYQAAMIQYSPELKLIASKIGYQDSILNSSKANLDMRHKQFETELSSKLGFLERNKALSDLSDQEPSIFWAELFISLLIILMEVGPILSKLMMSAGPYDVALAKIELLQMAASENEMRREKQLQFDKLDSIYKNKKEITDELMEQIKESQRNNIKKSFDQWENGGLMEKKKIPMKDLVKDIKSQFDFEEADVL